MGFIEKVTAFCREKLYIRYAFSFLAVILLSAALTVIALAMTVVPFDSSRFFVLLSDALLFSLNALPIFLVMSVVYLLSGRIWIGFTVTGLFTFLIAEINRLKIFYREDPFVYSDLLLVKETGKMLESYDISFDVTSWISLVSIIVIAVLCFFFLRGLSFRFRLVNTILRTVIAGMLLFLLAFAGNNLYFKNGTVYQKLWHEDFGSEWNECNNYSSRGVVYSFLRSASIPPVTKPYNYNEESTKEILDAYSDVMLPEDKKVNVISVMLEAFADFSECDGVEFAVDPYANFRNIKENSYSGSLIANVFGGGTIETERAFLAGISNSNVYKRDTLSHVRYFGDNGYYTEAIHPYYGWFYNRNNINRYLGFDNFKTYENYFSSIPDESLLEPLYFGIASDTDVFWAIKESFEETVSRGEKYFNFTVTYQNHGPFYTYPTVDREIIKKDESYAEGNYNEANNYFYGIAKTDASLGNFIEYIDSQAEPIVFIAFGDHKPGFSEETYEMLGVKLDFSSIEGIKNYYTVPYFFYANDAAKKALGKDFKEEGDIISPMFLMNELFDYVDLDGSAYLNYMSDVKNEYDVIHYSVCAKDGEFDFRGNTTNSAVFEERQNVEYYMKNKKVRKK